MKKIIPMIKVSSRVYIKLEKAKYISKKPDGHGGYIYKYHEPNELKHIDKNEILDKKSTKEYKDKIKKNIEIAYQLGKNAYKEGKKNLPQQDKKIDELTSSNTIATEDIKKILKEWQKGYTDIFTVEAIKEIDKNIPKKTEKISYKEFFDKRIQGLKDKVKEIKNEKEILEKRREPSSEYSIKVLNKQIENFEDKIDFYSGSGENFIKNEYKKEYEELEKASRELMEELKKAGKPMPVGTVSKGRKKMPDGSWKPVTEEKKEPGKEPEEKKEPGDNKSDKKSKISKEHRGKILDAMKRIGSILSEALSGKDVNQPTGSATEETGETLRMRNKPKENKPKDKKQEKK